MARTKIATCCSRFRTKRQSTVIQGGVRYTLASRADSMRPRQPNPLEVPNYTIEEAARYLHILPSKLRYWVIGDEDSAPLTTIYSHKPMLLSFKNLVECFVLESLRHAHNVSLQGIRHGVEELRREKPSKYPLADYDLSTEKTKRGVTIYLEDKGVGTTHLVNLRAGGQQVFNFLQPWLRRVERNTHGIAQRLFPFTRKEYLNAPANAPQFVVIDPTVSFGMPVLVDSRISTAFLLSRKNGGATIPQLANDYGRLEAEIEEAIKIEQAA
ncbi:MAG TPA: DUF433 domain-containing protein [Terriglobales bacterium]|nr:DUF433 domain-containing protein [Terriglobales bacterium]